MHEVQVLTSQPSILGQHVVSTQGSNVRKLVEQAPEGICPLP